MHVRLGFKSKLGKSCHILVLLLQFLAMLRTCPACFSYAVLLTTLAMHQHIFLVTCTLSHHSTVTFFWLFGVLTIELSGIYHHQSINLDSQLSLLYGLTHCKTTTHQPTFLQYLADNETSLTYQNVAVRVVDSLPSVKMFFDISVSIQCPKTPPFHSCLWLPELL